MVHLTATSLGTRGVGSFPRPLVPSLPLPRRHVLGKCACFCAEGIGSPSFDFVVWFYGRIDINKLIVKERTRPDGTRYRPEPLVWRYKWCPERKRVLTHYKMALNSFATPEQDEWGPFEDAVIDYEDADTGGIVRKIVARTVPAGVEYMLSIPDVRVDPGFDAYLDAASWSRHQVFDGIGKWKFPPSAPIPTPRLFGHH
eukprot:scaffold36278_cov134-Isochrysis_galbana.AAC.2